MPSITVTDQLLHKLQHTPLFLVQSPHQPAQLPHLGAVGTMHRAGFRDALPPLRRSGPVLAPPCILHLPFGIAGPLQGVQARVRAPHRGQA